MCILLGMYISTKVSLLFHVNMLMVLVYKQAKFKTKNALVHIEVLILGSGKIELVFQNYKVI